MHFVVVFFFITFIPFVCLFVRFSEADKVFYQSKLSMFRSLVLRIFARSKMG